MLSCIIGGALSFISWGAGHVWLLAICYIFNQAHSKSFVQRDVYGSIMCIKVRLPLKKSFLRVIAEEKHLWK